MRDVAEIQPIVRAGGARLCSMCGRQHHVEEPHFFTRTFELQFELAVGRSPTKADTYSHCRGISRAAAEAALEVSSD